MSTRFTKKKLSGKKITPTGFVAYRIVDGKLQKVGKSLTFWTYTQIGVIEPTEKATIFFSKPSRNLFGVLSIFDRSGTTAVKALLEAFEERK
jgi:hypothetical protein